MGFSHANNQLSLAELHGIPFSVCWTRNISDNVSKVKEINRSSDLPMMLLGFLVMIMMGWEIILPQLTSQTLWPDYQPVYIFLIRSWTPHWLSWQKFPLSLVVGKFCNLFTFGLHPFCRIVCKDLSNTLPRTWVEIWIGQGLELSQIFQMS